ncbi:MAG: hypothetical protein MJA29_06140, partial [Candidatus Omnitrophica bacterium]|nr:hypothetical protein [Candidatus Omnitrophota bacterium]
VQTAQMYLSKRSNCLLPYVFFPDRPWIYLTDVGDTGLEGDTIGVSDAAMDVDGKFTDWESRPCRDRIKTQIAPPIAYWYLIADTI